MREVRGVVEGAVGGTMLSGAVVRETRRVGVAAAL